MARLEKFSEADFMRDVERVGGQSLKQDPSVNTGIPDRLNWVPFKDRHGITKIVWFWAEWKRDANHEPTKVQLAYHRKLRSAGHTLFIFNDNVHARRIIDQLVYRGYAIDQTYEAEAIRA